jgi:hypothetical protein
LTDQSTRSLRNLYARAHGPRFKSPLAIEPAQVLSQRKLTPAHGPIFVESEQTWRTLSHDPAEYVPILLARPLVANYPLQKLFLMRDPSVSKTQLAFSYASNIWIADRDGNPTQLKNSSHANLPVDSILQRRAGAPRAIPRRRHAASPSSCSSISRGPSTAAFRANTAYTARSQSLPVTSSPHIAWGARMQFIDAARSFLDPRGSSNQVGASTAAAGNGDTP